MRPTVFVFGLVCVCTILTLQAFDSKTKQNDVFLNFGTDTRRGIISHLDVALHKRNIKTCLGSALPRGEDIASPLKEIEASRVAVVFFSKDYASSSWCLDELVRITECRGIPGLKVLPIFYGISPSDVRNQTGSFQAAFDRHEEEYKDKVQMWREALMQVSDIAGLVSNPFMRDADLVKQAVDEVAELLGVSRPKEECAARGDYAQFCHIFCGCDLALVQ